MLRRQLLVLVVTFCFVGCATFTFGQTSTKTKTAKPPSPELNEQAAQQRAVAISLVTTLADEARSFKDQTRRARVQARAADILWDSDPERSKELFRRAWDAATVVDTENARTRAEALKKANSDGGQVVVRGGPDIRSEVLRLAAKRDKKLGDEFLKILDEAEQKQREDAANATRKSDPDSLLGASKRLQLARRLVQDGEIERAMEFAGPALDRVTIDSIFFLSALREKNNGLADAAFQVLLARVSRDPSADANTVSGLSSYIFTPFLYVTFERGGGSNWNLGKAHSSADARSGVSWAFARDRQVAGRTR